MATVDRPHRVGFALIPALAGAFVTLGCCAASGAEPFPWAALAAVASGAWGYRYARRWNTHT
ncbi:hypothetical protein [Streptomyces sp. NPDC051662]|uniref:hypothetical protein n=1 Tax=Streptomyces sp. NPDC051662 TaxID=3154750 RepID=UPI00343D948A